MRYFLDTEFIEDGKTIDLISIGIVAEDGRELYLQNDECDLSKANEWVKTNVIMRLWNREPYAGYHNPVLRVENTCWRTRKELVTEILAFIDNKPEFWGYYADYDWVVICQLFGRMIDLPAHWPMYCNDIKQLCMEKGNPNLHEVCDTNEEHHALVDARWNKCAYNYLRSLL